MKGKFALIDHKLRESGGHQIRMAEIFLSASDEFVAYGCANCVLEHERLINHFQADHRVSHRFAEMPPAGSGLGKRFVHRLHCLGVMFKSNINYYRDLCGIKTDQDTVWFAPNTQQFTFPALIVFAFLHPSRRIAAYFQNAPGKYLRACGALIRVLRLRNLVCVAEEETMRERMAVLMGVPVKSLLYPLLPRNLTDREFDAFGAPVRPISIAVLGLPRREKGFLLVPHVVKVLEREIAAGEISFVVQTGSPGNDEEGLEEAIASLRDCRGVDFIESTLDPNEYLDELLRCGAVLTPYLEESYARRLSWITIEGAAVAKPVLVTEATLAAGFVDEYGAGIKFRDQDVAGIASAIRRLSDHYETYLEQARHAGMALRGDNSSDKFFSAIRGFFA